MRSENYGLGRPEPNTDRAVVGDALEGLPGSKSVARAAAAVRNQGDPAGSRRTNHEGQAGRRVQRPEGHPEASQGVGFLSVVFDRSHRGLRRAAAGWTESYWVLDSPVRLCAPTGGVGAERELGRLGLSCDAITAPAVLNRKAVLVRTAFCCQHGGITFATGRD